MQAVIPAAGEGTRLGELADERPKGLVEVAGRPLLSYAFDTVQSIGATHLLVVIGHHGEAIIEHFGDSFEELPITYVHQRERRGLAHAVCLTASYIDGPFMIHNGDNIIQTELQQVIDRGQEETVDGVMLVDSVSEEAASSTGVISLRADGTIAGMVEKPEHPPSKLVSTGFFVLPQAIFHACALVQPGPTGERELSTAIDLLARAGYHLEPMEIDEGWRLNVNTPADIERAESLLD